MERKFSYDFGLVEKARAEGKVIRYACDCEEAQKTVEANGQKYHELCADPVGGIYYYVTDGSGETWSDNG